MLVMSCHHITSTFFHTVLKYLFLVLLLLLFAFVFILFHKNAEHTYINLAAFCQKLFQGLVKNIHSNTSFIFYVGASVVFNWILSSVVI